MYLVHRAFKMALLPVFLTSILGGHDIRIKEAPYHVNYGDICGAVLIHKKYALTTAHCGNESFYIRIGNSRRLQGSKIMVVSHIIHPNYKMEHSFDFDVQLLELNRGLHFGTTVRALPISEGQCGDTISLCGWGYSEEKGDYQDRLQQVQLSIVPMKRCQEVGQRWYNHTLTSRMFCAGGWGRDACQGDSGGAAVSFGHLVGLSSFGYGCGRKMPGVYINVSEYRIREWIRNYTGV